MAFMNIPKTTIKKVEKTLLHMYTKAIQNKMDLKTIRAVCLWSSPGIGKSQMVGQLCEELSKNLGKKVIFRDIRLSDCTIFELLGLMRTNKETNQVEYVQPPIYDEVEKDAYIVYLFDELDKASLQLQSAALHLILDRKFWQYALPENSIVIAAGNPENVDGEVFSKFKSELNNRFRHYLIEANYQCWKEWAEKQNANHFVLEYLAANNQMIYSKDAGEENTAFASPRSWMAVSDYLNLMLEEGERPKWEDLYVDIAGDIGKETAAMFKTFCKMKGILPITKDIFLGIEKRVPKKAEHRYTVIDSMKAYVEENYREMNLAHWSNACAYINQFAPEYAFSFYRDLSLMGGDVALYRNTPEYRAWEKVHGPVHV